MPAAVIVGQLVCVRVRRSKCEGPRAVAEQAAAVGRGAAWAVAVVVASAAAAAAAEMAPVALLPAASAASEAASRRAPNPSRAQQEGLLAAGMVGRIGRATDARGQAA